MLLASVSPSGQCRSGFPWGCCQTHHTSRKACARPSGGPQFFFMRSLASLLVVAILAVGIYVFYLKKMPTTDEGTAPTQAISLTGVRSDLLQIAQAERAYIALNSRCVALDELISSGSLSMHRTERDGYTYQISCSGTEFQVVAQHPPAPQASPIRYPALTIDSSMKIQELPAN
jgi:hypothetical protein